MIYNKIFIAVLMDLLVFYYAEMKWKMKQYNVYDVTQGLQNFQVQIGVL